MIKFVIPREKTFTRILKCKILREFVVYPLDQIQEIKDYEVFCGANKRFFLNNLTKKTTDVGRFKELELGWDEFLDKKQEYQIHDVAVSSGVTSLELLDTLKKYGIKPRLHISDKYSAFYIRKNAFCTTVFDANKELLHFYWFGLFASGKEHPLFFLSKILFFVLKGILNPTFDEASCEKYSLYHSSVHTAISAGAITEIDYDIFTGGLSEKFDAVRAMNIINENIFTKEQLKLAVGNIRNSLKENGLLLVGITNKSGVNNASWYRKSNNVFTPIKSLNDGFPHHEIIASS